MVQSDAIYRADNIGSMLRPDELHAAREQHGRGELTDAEFKRVEDRAVDECIAIQERAGIDIVTDGEMRRHVFASQHWGRDESRYLHLVQRLRGEPLHGRLIASEDINEHIGVE